MGTPLLSAAPHSPGFFGTLARWDAETEATGGGCKANFVFFLKKVFAFLDQIYIGKCLVGNLGLTGNLEIVDNREARKRIVEALGGVEACRSLRTVSTLNASDFAHYLRLGDAYFNRGESIVQGEDSVGRKFVILRLADRTGQVAIATIHQRYLENDSGGSLWTTNMRNTNDLVQPNTNDSVTFIQDVRAGRHPNFVFAPKP